MTNRNQSIDTGPRIKGKRKPSFSLSAIRFHISSLIPSSRSGQAIIFLMMVIVILFFVVLWNFDLHGIIRIKDISQNAGDSAALMAARWQAITMNVIGDLNIMQALALSVGNEDLGPEMNDIQARLCYVGPMIAFLSCQQAAKQNGIYRNEDFDEILKKHADAVRNDYTAIQVADGEMLFPEPYPGAWEEYADMLDLIASEGVAVGADNVRYYGDSAGGSHFLLDPGFYGAIAGEDWCWFWHHNTDHSPPLLAIRGVDPSDAYFRYTDWPELPEPTHRVYMNSEIFGLGLSRVETTLDALTSAEQIDTIAEQRGFAGSTTATGMTTEATWYCYGSAWSGWDAMAQRGPYPFPAAGRIKSQYDYSGADVIVRVQTQMNRLTPGAGGTQIQNKILWTAAAKPFGYLNTSDKPNSFDIVLPAFREVALVPVDAASGGSGGGYDLQWREHIEKHLPDYLSRGPRSGSSCRYCQNLCVWESPTFRQKPVTWLKTNSHLCDVGPGGGGPGGPGPGPGRGPGGGRRRAH